MSDKKINLEEILNKMAEKAGYSNFVHCFVEQEYTEEVTKEAMIEAIRQSLELAADAADLSYCTDKWEVPEGYVSTGDYEYGYNYIDKRSILNTINQIE